MSSKNRFEPSWRETPPADKSYRSVFKWGAPDGYKHPNHKLFEEIKTVFNMKDSDFTRPVFEGDEPVALKAAPKLSKKILADCEKI